MQVFWPFLKFISLFEGRVLHKEAWVATLLGTLFGAQDDNK